ncbi:lysostaphin resistance A-like protein [Nonomuraea sp. NPDC050556]|uniref:lysostaphin resistance A-like protein n=1 Tax=Nonomuraea sp. NPDC050556 TaxID=3364369 RepID=UPI0037A2A3AD
MYENPYPAPPQPVSWFAPTPPGTRYDHLGRNAANAWWRPILGTLIIGAGFFVIGAVVIVLGVLVGMPLGIRTTSNPEQLFSDPVYNLVVVLLSIAAVLPLVFGTAALLQRRRPGTLSSVAGRLRWGWLLQCAGLAAVALVLGQVAQYVVLLVTGEDTTGFVEWGGWAKFLPGMIVIVLLVPFQAAAEEYIFRGWFIQAFGAYIRNPLPGILLGSAAFTSMHGYTGWGIVDVFTFGAIMGWLAVRTGGLEAAIAMHVMNNVMAFGLIAAAGQLEKAMEQGDVPWQSLAGTVVQLVVFVVGVLILSKKRSIDTVSG